jgi:hypothetical protein
MTLQIELNEEQYAAAAAAANGQNQVLSEWAKEWLLEASDTCDNPIEVNGYRHPINN